MRALTLRLLLILSLVFNAVASPWAMAQMQHDGHAHDGVPTALQPETAMHDHATMSHGSTHEHADMLETAHAKVPDHSGAHGEDNCCDGAMCPCGCIVPPAVVFLAMLSLDPQVSLPVEIVLPGWVIVARGSPPFRPPAA